MTATKVQLYAVSENEVIADDLGSGTYFKFCLDGNSGLEKGTESREKTVFRQQILGKLQKEKKTVISVLQSMEYLGMGILRQQQCYKDILPTGSVLCMRRKMKSSRWTNGFLSVTGSRCQYQMIDTAVK